MHARTVSSPPASLPTTRRMSPPQARMASSEDKIDELAIKLERALDAGVARNCRAVAVSLAKLETLREMREQRIAAEEQLQAVLRRKGIKQLMAIRAALMLGRAAKARAQVMDKAHAMAKEIEMASFLRDLQARGLCAALAVARMYRMPPSMARAMASDAPCLRCDTHAQDTIDKDDFGRMWLLTRRGRRLGQRHSIDLFLAHCSLVTPCGNTCSAIRSAPPALLCPFPPRATRGPCHACATNRHRGCADGPRLPHLGAPVPSGGRG